MTIRRRMIVHIGMPKTGSSTIQAFLGRNSDALRARGVGVLGVGDRANHEVLANELLQLDALGAPASVFAERGSVADCLPDWGELTTQMLSMETFWGPGPNAVGALRHHAGTVDADVEVIGFFRSPETWLWSWWAQETKASWIDWCDFIDRAIRDRRGFLSRSFAAWISECPDAVLRFRPYEGPNLVQRFLAGVSISSEGLHHDVPIQNVGEDRVEVIRRAAIVREVWRGISERFWLESAQLDHGLASRLMIEATKDRGVGYESSVLHRSVHPDIASDPTFNGESLPLIAEYAASWAADAHEFMTDFGAHFDSESHSCVLEKIAEARRVAYDFREGNAESSGLFFPRRDFFEDLPTNSFEVALVRGLSRAVSGALLYVQGLRDVGGDL